MPFVTPPNFVAGQVLTEAQLDTLSDDLNALASPPRARVYNSAALSIANNTQTALTFNSERYDSGGVHSTATNTNRLTVPTGWGGVWVAGAAVEFAANATGYRALRIAVNGTTTITEDGRNAAGGGFGSLLTITCEYPLVSGDYFEVYVFQTSGAALNVNSVGNRSPEAWCRWTAL